MEIHTLILLTIILYLTFHAYINEKTDGSYSYTKYIPKDNDNIKKLYRKIEGCLLVNKQCIKWRRSYVSAIIGTIIIFSFIHNRIPNINEALLYIFVIYIVYYISWEHFANTVSKDVEIIGKNIIKRIQKYKKYV